MFSEKEKDVLQALVEEEIAHIARETERDKESAFGKLYTDYRITLTKILLKVDMDDCRTFNAEYSNILSNELLSRQST